MRLLGRVALGLGVFTSTTTTIHAYDNGRPEHETEEQKQQDVFLACLNSFSYADKDHDNRITKHEYKLFLKYFSSQLYTNPLFPDGTLPDPIKELFQDLVLASGVEQGDFYDHDIDVLGSKVEDMPNVGAERFEDLHHVCNLTVEALKEEASKTAAVRLLS